MSAQGNPFRTLAHHRDLRLLFIAGVASDVGTWMQAVTVGTLVATTSRSAGATALVMSVMFLPQGVCSPLGGLLADRYDRRRMAMVLLSFQTVLAACLALLIRSGVTSALALAGVILVQGCVNALAMPAMQALTPQLVPREDLLSALSLGSISWNSGRIFGPTLAAVCTAAFGSSTTVMMNAASFLVPIAALASIRRPFHSGTHVAMRRFVTELKAGATLARRTPSIRVLLPSAVVVQLMLSSLLPAVPYYARNVLHGSTALVTVMFTACGAGAMLSAAFTPGLTLRLGRSRLARLSLGGLISGVALAAVAHNAVFGTAAVALYGAGLSGFFVSTGTVVQRDAPESHRGRLVSIYTAVVGMAYGIGAPLNGWIADRFWGFRTHLLVWACVLAVAALAVQLRRPEWYGMLDGTDPEPRWRRTRALALDA